MTDGRWMDERERETRRVDRCGGGRCVVWQLVQTTTLFLCRRMGREGTQSVQSSFCPHTHIAFRPTGMCASLPLLSTSPTAQIDHLVRWLMWAAGSKGTHILGRCRPVGTDSEDWYCQTATQGRNRIARVGVLGARLVTLQPNPAQRCSFGASRWRRLSEPHE